jgi:hypothetical protein
VVARRGKRRLRRRVDDSKKWKVEMVEVLARMKSGSMGIYTREGEDGDFAEDGLLGKSHIE